MNLLLSLAQYLLPHQLLSRLMLMLTRVQWRPWKNFLIRLIAKRFKVDWSEAANPDPDSYIHFNAFFTRALKEGARVPDADPYSLLMPADGRISQLGRIVDGRIFQAKGKDYTTGELLGSAHAALPFRNGSFITIYLSPRDYHRVHMPWDARLAETRHMPGRLFSVSPGTVENVPRLFARNERLVCSFDADFGAMTLVMVGALLVSGVETVWNGVEIPPYAGRVFERDYAHRQPPVVLKRFAEMARFNYGSTVIVLLPEGAVELDPELSAGQPVRLGQKLARRVQS
jgi:phosphatidylserine decarboxylase